MFIKMWKFSSRNFRKRGNNKNFIFIPQHQKKFNKLEKNNKCNMEKIQTKFLKKAKKSRHKT